jgi:hypothetical protein
MRKKGKYTKSMAEPKMAGAPYGQSNKGWDARQNMMKEMMEMEPRQRPKAGYVGAAPDPQMKRPRST